MFSKATKTLLKNYIRHTDTHNRILEESDMWRMHEEEKQRKHEAPRRRAHMDEYGPRKSGERTSELKRDTFWMKRLQETEEQDPDRWGHGGYKEMHPEEFNSSLSESSDSESPKNKRHKKKTKTKKKEKKKKSKKKKSKKHKRQKKSKINSELESSALKETKGGKGKRETEHNFSTDSSGDSEYSDSDCERQNSKAKRKRRNGSYSSDSDESPDEPKKRQKFTSERPHSTNDVRITENIKWSKSRKNSRHKTHKSSIGKGDSFGNDVVWLEKTSL